MELTRYLIERGWLKTPHIINAFETIKREDFVPEELKDLASIDEALPIGSGQTISQPSVVAFMLEELRPKRDEKIMDIGAGSGWTTALLASIVGANGKVIAIEVLKELCEFGKRNVGTYSFIDKGIVEFYCKNGAEGHAREAPYDKILVSASLSQKKLPSSWKKQLKVGGRIVVPIENSLWTFTKISKNEFSEKEHPGFVFVPFV